MNYPVDREQVIAEERARIGTILVPLAVKGGWCGEFEAAWRAVWPGTEPVDSEGYNLQGWKGDVHRDGATRPPKPTEDGVWVWRLNGCTCGCDSTGPADGYWSNV